VAAAALIGAGAFAAVEHHEHQHAVTVLTGVAYVGHYEASVTVDGWVYGLVGPGHAAWVDSKGVTHKSGWPACLTGPGQFHRITFGEMPVTTPGGGMVRQIVWVDCPS
jgi:hypothetical protein